MNDAHSMPFILLGKALWSGWSLIRTVSFLKGKREETSEVATKEYTLFEGRDYIFSLYPHHFQSAL